MSFVGSLASRCACRSFRYSSSLDLTSSRLSTRFPSRTFASENEKQPPLKFPSFSTKSEKKPGTNFDGFQPNPHPSVFTNTIFKGEPNHSNLPRTILDNLGQSPNELLKGASFAIEAVTSEISSQRLDVADKNDSDDIDVLRDCLTPDCLYRLRNCYLMVQDLREKHFLVNTKKDDIFFSWINKLSVDEYGSYLMQVCTMSFPQHGFIAQKRDEAKETQGKMYAEMKKATTKEEQKEFEKRFIQDIKPPSIDGYEMREFIRCHDVIASNFFFKRGPAPNDSWLIDEIMMKNTTEVFSTLKCLRWKGRMVFSLMGMSWKGIFVIDAVYAGMMTALVATIV